MKHQVIRTYLISFTFLLALAFPLFNYYTGIIRDIDSFENRSLAREPELTIKSPKSFPQLYDKFYNDHFILRNSLIKNYSIFKLLFFKQSPFPGAIVVGSNNWLYQAGDELDIYTGKLKLSLAELESLRVELEYRKNYLEKRGCKFYLMVVPSKACIHNEHMGIQYYRVNEVSLGEQLVNYLSHKSDVKQINLFQLLRNKKKENDVYYKMDNHWNKIGALYAANELFSSLNIDYKLIHPLKLKEVKRIPIKSPNLLKMIGNLSFLKEFENEPVLKGNLRAKKRTNEGYKAPKEFPYPYLYEYRKETGDSSKPSLLVICDSFGENIFPFLAENFKKSVKIWDSWQYKLNEDIVEKERPGVFLLLVHEKNLKQLLKYASCPQKKYAHEKDFFEPLD